MNIIHTEVSKTVSDSLHLHETCLAMGENKQMMERGKNSHVIVQLFEDLLPLSANLICTTYFQGMLRKVNFNRTNLA